MSRKPRLHYLSMLGHDLKKGVVCAPNMGGFDVAIVWLNRDKEYASGKPFLNTDIEKIDHVLHFCDVESVRAMIKILEHIEKQMEVDNENNH